MINISQNSPAIGIYKITSPSGKVYIGQSVNITKRWKAYGNLHKSTCGPHLLRSLNKHGYENHLFEIIELCSVECLSERETYWKQQELNKVNGDFSKVLFCELHDSGGGPRSEQIKEKIRQSHTGKKRPEGFGERLSQKTKGKPKPEGYSEKLKQALKGKTRSEETKKRMSDCRIGIPNLKNKKPKPPEFGKYMTGRLPKAIHQISPTDNSIIATYPSAKSAAETLGIQAGSISRCCTGGGITAGKYKWSFVHN